MFQKESRALIYFNYRKKVRYMQLRPGSFAAGGNRRAGLKQMLTVGDLPWLQAAEKRRMSDDISRVFAGIFGRYRQRLKIYQQWLMSAASVVLSVVFVKNALCYKERDDLSTRLSNWASLIN